MNLYKFETDQFGISDNGIHLLRSRYNYETIKFSDLSEIRIEKGRQIANWFLTFMFGIALILIGFYVGYQVLHTWFFGEGYYYFHVNHFAFPILPIIVGSYSLFVSLKTGFVMTTLINGKTKKFPIDTLKKQNQIDEFVVFLNTNILIKNKFKSSI